MFSSKFHSKCRTRDLVRRRRWHRKMVQTDPTAPAVFYISEEVREQVSSIRYSSSGSSLVIIKNHSVTELGSNLKFFRHHFLGKPVVALGNAGCFLRL